MIIEFLLILMTRNLAKQASFYKDVLELDLQFEHQDTCGFGKHKQLFIVLRTDTSENSHHLAEHKGPQIITFKCHGDMEQYATKIKEAGFKIRDTLKLPEHHIHYLFTEDYDGNELCLSFTLNNRSSSTPQEKI